MTGAMPKRVIVVLLDSLNRHHVGAYGGDEFETPNIDRLARRSVRFTRHFAGSLPCMPARHDILVGSLDFLWRPWGSIEVWEDAVTFGLRKAGVTTMLVSDHPHLFERGGENYHVDFDAWEYLRGGEGDPWKTYPDPSAVGTPLLPPAAGRAYPQPYDTSRSWFRTEEDLPGPRTMQAAVEWLRTAAGRHERFFLFVDEFDPHEPFDTTARWYSRYDDGWDGPRVIWPPYRTDALASGAIDERTARHVRANYGAKLSMIDHWFGSILDVLDEQRLWDDTAVILTTDHGHYLGEHDIFGKPPAPIWNTLGHIPLLASWPGVAPQTVDALTASVDIHATIADVFAVAAEHRTHGRSLVPLITGERDAVRDHLVSGYWGREVNVVDRERKYVRAPVPGNRPLALWSNRWSTMPVHALPELRLPRPNHKATLRHVPGSDTPVIRQPFDVEDRAPWWVALPPSGEHLLFDLADDPGETSNLAGSREETDATDLLRAALEEVEAPAEQFERLGIA